MEPTLVSAGYEFRHEPGFIIDRPRGLRGEWLLLQCTSPVIIHSAGNLVMQPGGMMLWAPGEPHRYQGQGGGLENHWCHARGLEELVRELDIPTQTVCIPDDPERTPLRFAELVLEERRRAPGWRQVTASVLVALLRSMAGGGQREALSDLRADMLAALDRPWSIAQLARRLHCSVPTVHRRWRAAFGLSPVDDLIRARLDRAEWLITVAGHSVRAAAVAVGYEDARYFARLCRRHRGVAPSSWARPL